MGSSTKKEDEGTKWQERGLTFSVGLCASLHEPYGVFDELPAGLDKLHDLIHGAEAADTSDNISVSRVQALAALSADVDFSSPDLHDHLIFLITNIPHISDTFYLSMVVLDVFIHAGKCFSLSLKLVVAVLTVLISAS